MNCIATFEGDSLTQPGFVNGYVKPLHYIAQFDGNSSYILIDTDEAATLLRKRNVSLLWLIDHGPLIAERTIPSEIKKIEVQAKLLGGNLEMNEDQKQIFNECFALGYKSLLDDFIREILKPLYPLQT